MFTPEEYEAYKQKVIPQRIKNRIYTCYSNPAGMDCKLIGPETPCFCTHRYKQHETDFAEIPSERPIKLRCRASGCACASYHYVPLNGSQSIRCTCKHLADDHKVKAPFVCKKGGCTKCTGFKSSFTCACGSTHNEHQMIIETAEERQARGHPLGEAVPYQAMGGITGFSSLAEGYLRLDPSGRAAITGPEDKVFDDIEERISATRREGESDMDYYERRYQERLKLEAAAKRKAIPNPYNPGSTSKTGIRKAVEPSTSRTKSGKAVPGGKSSTQPGSSKQ
ncbi:protein fam221a-like [Plakobranchus ocellatus]|uniref:Protein FAM221A n=1 Tax=Plakobranchus ocellatus TaxID=259542 RepID=A0AAV4CT26_9GAST|nr:protein fam221a-like [Plakobranchus ocellatus]